MLDVLEVPDVSVDLSDRRRIWKHGSVGVGVAHGPSIWKEHKHVFESQTRQTSCTEPGDALKLGSPSSVSHNVLNLHLVDCLLVEQMPLEVWKPWLEKAAVENRPKVTLAGLDDDSLARPEGPIPKPNKKGLQQLGCDVQCWYLKAWDHGAALERAAVFMTCVQTENRHKMIKAPKPTQLPARPMSNLLMPFGVPHGAKTKQMPRNLPEAVQRSLTGPCEIVGHLKGEWVYHEKGAMPDEIGHWIQCKRDTHRLQHAELAKAKGLNEMLANPDDAAVRPTIKQSVGMHVWTAALGAVGKWQCEVVNPGPTPGAKAGPPKPTECAPGLHPAEDTEEEIGDWSWEPPDLREGGQWHQERVANLRMAIRDLPEAERLHHEGLEALKVHRGNCTDEGPKRSQSLWWEFPEPHRQELREGCRMNFLITPKGELVPNGVMDEEGKRVAGKFVDQLKDLGVLRPAQGKLRANCPLFCVDKPGQPGEKRCIGDCKARGGWSAVADASKHFHNFPTHPDEWQHLGCMHPITGEELACCGLPMGTGTSPSVACRVTNGALRDARAKEDVFNGSPAVNTWHTAMTQGVCDPRRGHGRVMMGEDGLPAALVWCMVDDFMVHAPTKVKCYKAFSAFMDHTVRLGFVCQKVKTSPPSQCQRFCGMIIDTTEEPKLRIPSNKVSRGIASIAFVKDLDARGLLTRLTASALGGFLQSLVEGTPSQQGQTCLRSLCDDIHHTTELVGRSPCCTKMKLSETTLQDLEWWEAFLEANHGNVSRAGNMQSVGVTWGDSSGTGTGGTFELVQHNAAPAIETWMGTWTPQVAHFDSNWRELRTLLWTLERMTRRNGSNAAGHLETRAEAVAGGTLFYFTDDLVTCCVVHNGSSTSPSLHALIRCIKLLEIQPQCRLEAVHVPGRLIIHQGTDGLSRGMWITAGQLLRSSVAEASLTFASIPCNEDLGRWALMQVGLPENTLLRHCADNSQWTWEQIGHGTSTWTPSPEVAHLAISAFLELWVESPWTTAGIFIIPRVLQRDWGFMSRHVHEIGAFHATMLPESCGYHSLIPLCVLCCPTYVRTLPPPDRLEPHPFVSKFKRWCAAQAKDLRGLR